LREKMPVWGVGQKAAQREAGECVRVIQAVEGEDATLALGPELEEGGNSPSGVPAIARKAGDRAGEGKVPLNEYEKAVAYLEAQKGKPKAAKEVGFRAGEGKEPANEYERACAYLEELGAQKAMPTPLSPERTSCDVPNEYEKAVAYLEAKKATGQIAPERIACDVHKSLDLPRDSKQVPEPPEPNPERARARHWQCTDCRSVRSVRP
jgi:hypothetical protein